MKSSAHSKAAHWRGEYQPGFTNSSQPKAIGNCWSATAEAELQNRGYFGVLDRLENTRLANDMPDCDRSACRDHSLRACDSNYIINHQSSDEQCSFLSFSVDETRTSYYNRLTRQ